MLISEAIVALKDEAETTEDIKRLRAIERELTKRQAWDYARWVNSKRQHLEREREHREREAA